MKPTTTIKMDGTGWNPVFVHSFGTEKEFISATEGSHYLHRDKKARKELLKQVYRLARAIKEKPIEADEE